MEEVMDSDGFMVGNTKLKLQPKTQSKTASKLSKVAPLKYWMFTFNNYDENDVSDVLNKLKEKCEKFVIQEELGENKTPHLQGSIKLLKPGRWSELKLSKKIHWDKTKSFDKSFEYCQKDLTRNGRRWIYPEPEEEIIILREEELYPWQKSVRDKCLEKPNDRDVNWIYDPDGNNGKSKFCKYMHMKHEAIICSGGCAKDIANLVKNIKESKRKISKIFILDLPRCKDGSVSYDILEQIKNGMITNTKYEAMNMIFNSPHLWIFSNEKPDKEKMTNDRWKIWTIKEKILFSI